VRALNDPEYLQQLKLHIVRLRLSNQWRSTAWVWLALGPDSETLQLRWALLAAHAVSGLGAAMRETPWCARSACHKQTQGVCTLADAMALAALPAQSECLGTDTAFVCDASNVPEHHFLKATHLARQTWWDPLLRPSSARLSFCAGVNDLLATARATRRCSQAPGQPPALVNRH
jgi:hypothetical protein